MRTYAPRAVQIAALAVTAALLTGCESAPADGPVSSATPAATATPSETATLDQAAVALQLESPFRTLVDECVASGDFTTVIDTIPCADLWSPAERERINPGRDTFDPEDIVYRDDWVSVGENSDQGVFGYWQWEQRSSDTNAGGMAVALAYETTGQTVTLTGITSLDG